MQKTFTLSELSMFTREEQKLLSDLGFGKMDPEEGPSEQATQNILNYSRALSVRKSATLEHIEMLLN